MTDKKLTDEDVVEGLKRCISTTTDKACEGCPFNKQNLCNKDQWVLERYALDLIKRQKAENDSAKAKIEICAEVIERQDAEIIKAIGNLFKNTDGIYELTIQKSTKGVYGEKQYYCIPEGVYNLIMRQSSFIYRQKTEIERLKSELSNMSEIKIEAYKKFAKKLKKRYDNPVWYLGGSNGFFDNLNSFVKEMVGEEE